MRGPGRSVVALVMVGLVVLGGAAPVAADSPGPTNYETVVTSIEPPTELAIEVIGGDSFIQLTRLDSERVEVVGYSGEPYLRFEPNGTVWENTRSPAGFINQDRFGTSADPPSGLDPDADPEWVEIADGGTYAWHDHRAHWMSESPPPGREPGDQILEAVIPLKVGGRDVDVTVASYWIDPPSSVPALLGGLVGLAVAVLLVVRRRSAGATAGVALAAALAATVMGVWATVSVPSSTGPSVLLWGLPVVAGLAAAAALIGARLPPVVRSGLVMLAGAEMLSWSVSRHLAIVRAVIPTDAPMALDRAVIVCVAVVSIGLLVAAGRTLVALVLTGGSAQTRPAPRRSST